MIITFSHIVDGQRVPLLDTEGREVTFSVSATDRTTAMNSPEVATFIEGKGTGVRVRRVD